MLPQSHILLGALASLALMLAGIPAWGALIIFLASFLIDIDHYLLYISKERDFNLVRAYKWFRKQETNHKPMLVVFHTVEFIFLIFIIALFSKTFLFILLGMLIHSLLDVIEMTYHRKFHCREYFLTRYLLSKDKKKYF